jgi:predicted  nucleic acid-binding Zn-ribbon protein
MLFPNVASRIEQLVQLYYTVNDRLRYLEEDMRRVKDEGRETNQEVANLKVRVAVLEETVRSLRAEMRSELRAVAAETVAELRIRFIEEAQAAQARASQTPTSLPPTTEEGR